MIKIIKRIAFKMSRGIKKIGMLLAKIIIRIKWIRIMLSRLLIVAVWPFYIFFENKVFSLILYLSQYQLPKIKLGREFLGSRKIIYFVSSVVRGNIQKTTQDYMNLLSASDVPLMLQREFGTVFLRAGRLDLATCAFRLVASQIQIENSIDIPKDEVVYFLREAGVAEFLYGKNDKANSYWKLAGLTRKTIYKSSIPRTYRILGNSWFVAIGHVAYLDYYIKSLQLYGKSHYRIVTTNPCQLACAKDFLEKFSAFGITLLKDNELEDDYNTWAQKNNAPVWGALSTTERAGLIDEFWEWEFPQNEILGFPHATNKIQKNWEKLALPPLLSLNMLDRAMLENMLLSLGLPAKTWYVCVHVRESGFHGKWNKIYPAMRDANIDDYIPAIQEIVKAGGWVIRMGDPTMKPLPVMSHVIDYTQSPMRNHVADRLLTASCQFFLGTNSGLNMVPEIYGIPCALTNWVPIGWPLWPKQDLMICKLFRDKDSKRFLTVEEIFENELAFLQNWADLPSNIELVDNTPEEIQDLTLEMLARFSYVASPYSNTKNSIELNEGYEKLAIKYDAYAGSQFAQTFLERHSDLFTCCKRYTTAHEIIEA